MSKGNRTIYIDDQLWTRLETIASRASRVEYRRVSVSELVTRALVQNYGPLTPNRSEEDE